MLSCYLIDLERTRVSESVVFWRPNGNGYTVNVDDAGVYSLEEAQRRVMDDRTIIVPRHAVPESSLYRLAIFSKYGEAFADAKKWAIPRGCIKIGLDMADPAGDTAVARLHFGEHSFPPGLHVTYECTRCGLQLSPGTYGFDLSKFSPKCTTAETISDGTELDACPRCHGNSDPEVHDRECVGKPVPKETPK